MGFLYRPVALSQSLYLFSFSLYSFVVLSLSPVSRLLREETLPSPLIFPLVSIIFLTGFRLSLFFVLFFPCPPPILVHLFSTCSSSLGFLYSCAMERHICTPCQGLRDNLPQHFKRELDSWNFPERR